MPALLPDTTPVTNSFNPGCHCCQTPPCGVQLITSTRCEACRDCVENEGFYRPADNSIYTNLNYGHCADSLSPHPDCLITSTGTRLRVYKVTVRSSSRHTTTDTSYGTITSFFYYSCTATITEVFDCASASYTTTTTGSARTITRITHSDAPELDVDEDETLYDVGCVTHCSLIPYTPMSQEERDAENTAVQAEADAFDAAYLAPSDDGSHYYCNYRIIRDDWYHDFLEEGWVYSNPAGPCPLELAHDYPPPGTPNPPPPFFGPNTNFAQHYYSPQKTTQLRCDARLYAIPITASCYLKVWIDVWSQPTSPAWPPTPGPTPPPMLIKTFVAELTPSGNPCTDPTPIYIGDILASEGPTDHSFRLYPVIRKFSCLPSHEPPDPPGTDTGQPRFDGPDAWPPAP